jgi:hypothetical protein
MLEYAIENGRGDVGAKRTASIDAGRLIWIERGLKIFFCAAAIVAEISPGVPTKACQGGFESIAELEPMLAKDATDFGAHHRSLRPDLQRITLSLLLPYRCPGSPHASLPQKLMKSPQ